MRKRGLRYGFIAALVTALGLAVQAEVKLPHTFSAGTPIKSAEVNANFKALTDATEALDEAKQDAITASPCPAGQFVRGVEAGGKLECGIDQIGTAGNAGVSSLNGKSGSLAIEAGTNVTVDTSDDGKITVSSGGGGGGLSLPFDESASSSNVAFQVRNTGTGSALAGLTSTGKTGVYGYNTNAEARSVGVWGRTDAAGTFGVYGSSANGYGVHGVSTSNAGVVGTSTGQDGVVGVSRDGRGVRGESTNDVGVLGVSQSNIAVRGVSGTNVGVSGVISSAGAGVNSAAVDGLNSGQGGYGVRGVHQGRGFGVYGNSAATGVGGESSTGIGVLGRGPTAMKAEGHAVQSLGSGGWAKAMIFVNPNATPKLRQCYNTQQTGALVDSGGCGIIVSSSGEGYWDVNFGFDISQRFFTVTLVEPYAQVGATISHRNATTLRIATRFHEEDHDFRSVNFPFYLIVF